MDGTLFDLWTRRRVARASGGLLAALLTLIPAWDSAAKRKKRRKRRKRKRKCGRNQKRCNGQCIKRSRCCGDGDCPADTKCCNGDCVSLDRPCGQNGLYACFSVEEGGVLRQSVEGEVYCTNSQDLPICAQCASSDGCLPDERCFAAHCAEEITAVCRKVYVDF